MKNGSWWQYIRIYKFQSIFIRNFLFLIIPIVVSLGIIGFAVYDFETDNIDEQIKSANMNMLQKVKSTCDMLMTESDLMLAKVASDNAIKMMMLRDKIQPAENIEDFKTITDKIGFITAVNNVFHSIYVYLENSDYVLSTNGDSSSRAFFYDSSWYAKYLQAIEQGQTYSIHARTYYDVVNYKTFYFLSSYLRINFHGHTGVVILNIDTLHLRNVIDTRDGDSGNSMLLITDDDGNILYATDPALITRTVGDTPYLNGVSFARQQSFFCNDPSGAKQVVSILQSDYNGNNYILISRKDQPSVHTVNFQRFLFLSIAACFFIAAVIALIISRAIYQPIINMISIFRTRNNWEGSQAETNEKGFNEFKYLSNSIRKSFDINMEMESELRERLDMLRKAQSIALQAQMNPHFLNNTIEALNWKAIGLTGGENEVSAMLRNLSKLLRLSLDTESNLVTIETEISHVNTYLTIQLMRYKNKFVVQWDIDPNVYGYKIIKLSLQPLVENSIYHGIKPKNTMGVIRISAKETDGGIAIVVFDNGVGLTAEQARELNESLKSRTIKEGQNIGLRNVNLRYQLMFGDDYTIIIESEPNEFTRLTLTLPKIR